MGGDRKSMNFVSRAIAEWSPLTIIAIFVGLSVVGFFTAYGLTKFCRKGSGVPVEGLECLLSKKDFKLTLRMPQDLVQIHDTMGEQELEFHLYRGAPIKFVDVNNPEDLRDIPGLDASKPVFVTKNFASYASEDEDSPENPRQGYELFCCNIPHGEHKGSYWVL